MKKAPQPKAVSMFKGIKGLVASGPGMTKKVDHMKVRPEGNIAPVKTAGAKKSGSAGPVVAGVVKPHGNVHIMSHIRPEGGTKRDSASVVKP